MQTITALNDQYGIPGDLRFTKGPGGLLQAEIENDQARAAVSLMGAHLLSFQPAGDDPVLWLSPKSNFEAGKPIRGGIPLCYPWFSFHPTDQTKPMHGFARIIYWDVLESHRLPGGRTQLVLGMQSNEETLAFCPYSFTCRYVITVGRELELTVTTHNTGSQPFSLTAALHTYYQVADIRNISITGLEGAEYIDKTDKFTRKKQTDSFKITSETDRVFCANTANCVIHDPGMGRRIRINKTNSRSTVVWNPWAEKSVSAADIPDDGYLRMLCVETANVMDDAITMAPGEEHSFGASIIVEK